MIIIQTWFKCDRVTLIFNTIICLIDIYDFTMVVFVQLALFVCLCSLHVNNVIYMFMYSHYNVLLYSMNIWRVLYLANLSFWKFHGYLI